MPVSVKDAAPGLAVDCALAAAHRRCVPAAQLAPLRPAVAAAFSGAVSAGILKQIDEQSLVALHVLAEALGRAGLTPADCAAWGVVAAPRAPGRRRIAESIAKFREQGAWAVSPHIIPHCSLHSLAGLLSQALQSHGPNLGAGGLPGTERDALWAALALLEGDRAPGVWAVLTGWDRESTSSEGTVCQAVALGLRRAAAGDGLPRLRVEPGGDAAGAGPFSLEALGQSIAAGSKGRWDLGGAVCTFMPAGQHLEAAA